MKIDLHETFRVLVIDDLVCRGKEGLSPDEIQNAVTNYLSSLAKAKCPYCWVEVCYVSTPEEGVSRWTQEVFDLTLVDSNFKVKDHKTNEDSWKRSFLDINIEFTGVYLFKFFEEMVKGSEYGDYRKGCKIALWTGLKYEKDPARAKKLLDLLSRMEGDKENETKVWFVPKDEVQEKNAWTNGVKGAEERFARIDVKDLKGCVDEILKSSADDKTTSTNLARLVSLYKTQTPETFAYLTGLGTSRVEHGYLVARDDGTIMLEGDVPEINDGESFVELSPRLRRRDLSFKSIILEKKAEKPVTPEGIPDLEVAKYLAEVSDRGALELPGRGKSCKKNGLVAAATPLTGCSAVGRKRAIRLMAQKVGALLNGPFEKVVLKTVYLDSLKQWEGVKWPCVQAQSHHQTRCLRSTEYPRTLWNTGVTAVEAFMPNMMNECLKQIDSEKRADVIVSLGSKFPQCPPVQENCPLCDQCLRNPKDVDGVHCRLHSYRMSPTFSPAVEQEFKRDLKSIWNDLFSAVFKDVAANDYPLVEINVRHYLRECVAYHLGGHEYLSPAKVGEKFTGRYEALDQEFKAWMDVLCQVAKECKKRLLFKLPFRGDDFHWIRLILDKAELVPDSPIAGITLINAFKSGVCEPQGCTTYSPAWYGRQDAWGDASDKEWKYQMSGELLTASRNELLGEVLKLAREHPHFQVHLSGGVVRGRDIREYRKIYYDKEGCLKCSQCIVEKKCPRKAFVCGQGIEVGKCKQCGACVSLCKHQKVVWSGPFVQMGTWSLLDLNLGGQHWNECMKDAPVPGVGRPRVDDAKCRKCPSCSVQCVQGAFVPGRGNAPAHIDLSKCIECKGCLNQCPNDAVVLERLGRVIVHEKKANGEREAGLKHRIAFWLHELCNGCGKCSRTFYCDTFLDRRGLDLPPVMDSRNCTGCGLCVQTCPQGAIQLFDPRHIVILIASTTELLSVWRERLLAYEIPHLVYTTVQIKNAYGELYSTSGAGLSPYQQWSEIVKVKENEFLKDCLVLMAKDQDKCEYFEPKSGEPGGLSKIDEIVALKNVAETRKEVNRRLAHLRK